MPSEPSIIAREGGDENAGACEFSRTSREAVPRPNERVASESRGRISYPPQKYY
jgi:hypothetical protein